MSAKLNLAAFGIVAAVGAIVRAFMLMFTVEKTSGFIKSEYMPWAIFIIAILFVSAAFVFFTSYLSKEKNEFSNNKSNIFYSVSEIILALAILYEAFFSPLLKYAEPAQTMLHKLAAVLSAAALLYIAFSLLTGREYLKYATIVPIAFFITRIIIVFSEFAALATVSDTIIETVCMCLALVTFLNFAKVSCGVAIKNLRLCKAVALLCSYVCIVGSVPRVACFIINTGAFEYFANIPVLTTLAVAIFSFMFALKCEE